VTQVATLVAGQQDMPDISEGEIARLPALNVANLSNPVPDVRRHSPWDHGDGSLWLPQ